jgi:hypothetical protein
MLNYESDKLPFVSVGWITADLACVQAFEDAQRKQAELDAANKAASAVVVAEPAVPFMESTLFKILLGCAAGAALVILITIIYIIYRCCKKDN